MTDPRPTSTVITTRHTCGDCLFLCQYQHRKYKYLRSKCYLRGNHTNPLLTACPLWERRG